MFIIFEIDNIWAGIGIDRFKHVIGVRLGFIEIHIVLTTVDDFVKAVYERNQVTKANPDNAFRK